MKIRSKPKNAIRAHRKFHSGVVDVNAPLEEQKRQLSDLLDLVVTNQPSELHALGQVEELWKHYFKADVEAYQAYFHRQNKLNRRYDWYQTYLARPAIEAGSRIHNLIATDWWFHSIFHSFAEGSINGAFMYNGQASIAINAHLLVLRTAGRKSHQINFKVLDRIVHKYRSDLALFYSPIECRPHAIKRVRHQAVPENWNIP